MNLQPRTFKGVTMHSYIQSHELVPLSGVHCEWVHLYEWVCSCVLYCPECSSRAASFQARSARGWLHWTLGYATQGAYWWRPDGTGGPEEGWRETRRISEGIHNAGNGRGFSLSEEARSVFEAQDPNVDRAVAAVQDPTQHHRVIWHPKSWTWWEKKSYYPGITVWFFSRGSIGLTPARNQNLSHQHQAWVMQLVLRLLLLMILQLHHLLPPLVSNSSCPFTWCQPLYVSCCTVALYFSRSWTVRLKMFYFSVCLVCIICVKTIIDLL